MIGRAFITLFIATGCSICAAQNPATQSVFVGKWTVTNVVGYGSTSGGIPEAKRLLGKTLTISAAQIDFAGERCRPDEGFSASIVDTASKLENYYGVNRADTGLPAKTALLDSASCTPVFLMDAHRVVFGWDGVILRAIKP